MKRFKHLLWIIVLVSIGCSGNSDNARTTATTFVSAPPRQILTIETHESRKLPVKLDESRKRVGPTQPLMIFNFAETKDAYPRDLPVTIDFSLANVKLKGDGGEFRVRYIIDDEDMRWIDRWESLWITGWTPGKHTIRLELIGPDGWPYRNGDYNIETRAFELY